MTRSALAALALLAVAGPARSAEDDFTRLQRSLAAAYEARDLEAATQIVAELQSHVLNTRLRVAAAGGDADAVAAALAAGADANTTAGAGVGLLASVASQCGGRVPIVDLLLDSGADPVRGDFRGNTAFQLAAASDQGCAHVFVRRGLEVDVASVAARRALVSGSRYGDLEAVVLLLDGGLDVDTTDPKRGWTLLMHAVEAEQEAVVQLLLGRGASPAIALDQATRGEHSALAERLQRVIDQSAGSDPSSQQRKQTKK